MSICICALLCEKTCTFLYMFVYVYIHVLSMYICVHVHVLPGIEPGGIVFPSQYNNIIHVRLAYCNLCGNGNIFSSAPGQL
jgi:hypothetical protein